MAPIAGASTTLKKIGKHLRGNTFHSFLCGTPRSQRLRSGILLWLQPRLRWEREILRLPDGVEPIAFTPLGYPADQSRLKERKPLSILRGLPSRITLVSQTHPLAQFQP